MSCKHGALTVKISILNVFMAKLAPVRSWVIRNSKWTRESRSLVFLINIRFLLLRGFTFWLHRLLFFSLRCLEVVRLLKALGLQEKCSVLLRASSREKKNKIQKQNHVRWCIETNQELKHRMVCIILTALYWFLTNFWKQNAAAAFLVNFPRNKSVLF